MIAFFETRFTIFYARLLSRRREELFASGDGLEGDDFFFAIIVSGARARAEEYAPHRIYSSFNDTKFVSARTAPSSRRGGALDASFATRRPKTHFDVNEKRIIFFFARRYLVQKWWMAPKEESTQITHRNILLFLKRYREQRNVSNRPPSLPPLSLLPPSSPRKPRTRRKTSSRKSRRANRFWSTSRGGLF